MTRARRARKASTPITIPAIAPPERPSDDDVALDEDCRSGTTIGVEVTVSVTASPEIVTTRVLVTGEGVAEVGIGELELLSLVTAATYVDEDEVDVDGGGVELVLVVLGGGVED